MKGYQIKTVKKGLDVIIYLESHQIPFTKAEVKRRTGLGFYVISDLITALTQNYNKREHGFNMPKMFDMDKDGYLTMRNIRNYKDNSIYFLISSAMSFNKEIRETQHHFKIRYIREHKKNA